MRGRNQSGGLTEWFKLDPQAAHEEFERFAHHTVIKNDDGHLEYVLRDEQDRAVSHTKAYFEEGGQEFLWNAKPRFGKTLTTYDLIQRLGYEKVLIVTNRPSIANSWREDFVKFVGWREQYAFVSENEAVRDKKGVMSRDEYTAANRSNEDLKMIAFESLPSLKGAKVFGGDYDKLEWLATLPFDLLVIDEAHEGVDTEKTDAVLAKIQAAHTLHLSGTPFKAMANQKFDTNQIFNWSYADEQEAKKQYAGEDFNPYETLPKLSMFTYQISEMMADEVRKGADLREDETVDYAFDLAEFFKVNNDGTFKYEAEVQNFLDALTTQEKYPFSTPELRDALSHTLWYMNRIDSVKAMARMLRQHPVFKDYKIVEAVGRTDDSAEDEAVDDDRSKKSLDKVRDAIKHNDKTITLSVGQLTVGVTVPEWSGVMMLCNLKSPAAYMQAAFRAQNPYETTIDGARYRKENAYVFDFDPTRTLKIFDDFANNLIAGDEGVTGGEEERKKNIKRLLNFFPVIGEDEEGKMIELDAAEVLSIPRRLMSIEVVRRGFMDNFLFQNIAGIFNAPAVIKDILEKVAPSSQGKIEKKRPVSTEADGIEVDDKGEPVISNEKVIGTAADMFGEKVYETISESVQDAVTNAAGTSNLPPNPPKTKENKMQEAIDKAAKAIVDAVSENVLDKAAEEYELKNQTKKSVKNQINREAKAKLENVQKEYRKEEAAAAKQKAKEEKTASTEEERQQAQVNYDRRMERANLNFTNGLQKAADEFVQKSGENVIEKVEKAKAKEKIKSATDDMRAHLRGFSRTIPSFLMAYGDENLTLANFDTYLEEEPFEEITGITIRDFKLLRDGGIVHNEETGQDETVNGHYFNEGVFNDSIKEFLKKKRQLANYFDETQEEDIFDYIPPQKTNQIFTPKWVVQKMLDLLEQENPGCFDNPDATFADLYMKSGLYIAEVIKRLYRSDGLKSAFPDDKERLRHILDHQVYGMAPTRVIYLIARNYVLGFDEEFGGEHPHFVQADAQKASVEGTLQELVDEAYGTGLV